MVATPPREAPWSSTFESGKKLLVIPHGTMRSLSKPHEVEEGTPRHPASQNRREGPLLLEPRDDGRSLLSLRYHLQPCYGDLYDHG